MTETFYHYTTECCWPLIIKDGKIKKSTKKTETGIRDSTHGEGVYLCKMDISNPKRAIAHNNWWGGTNAALELRRVDHVIKMIIRTDSSLYQKIKRCQPPPRHPEVEIYILQNEDLNLSECESYEHVDNIEVPDEVIKAVNVTDTT